MREGEDVRYVELAICVVRLHFVWRGPWILLSKQVISGGDLIGPTRLETVVDRVGIGLELLPHLLKSVKVVLL